MLRTAAFGLLLVGAIVAAWAVYTYAPPPPLHPPASTPPAETGDAHAVFSVPSIGLAFEYPDYYGLLADRRTQGDAAFLELKFTDGVQPEPGRAEVLIRRNAVPEDTRLEAWVRTSVGDSRRRLVVATCDFPSRAIECVEITDQSRWVEAGRQPPRFTVYMRVPGFVYSVAWGTEDTFDYRATGGRLLVESLRFGQR